MFLLNVENNSDYLYPFSYIDLTDNGDMLSFLSSDRMYDYEEREHFWSSKKRSVARVGKLVGRLLPVLSSKDIEDFVNAYRSEFNTNNDISFEIVNGNDIIKYYNGSTYEQGNGSLNRSCMRHDKCCKYMDIYRQNSNINMVILLNKKKRRILGRALLWKLTEPSGIYLMDRIYTVDDSIVHLFKKIAKKNGWLYKTKQTFDCVDVIDTDEKEKFIKMKVQLECGSDYYPYLDTLLYFNRKNLYLTNDIEDFKTNSDIIKLRDINGGNQDNENFVYDSINDAMIHIDDSIYCYYGDIYTHKNLAFFSESDKEYISPNNLRYSKTEDKFLHKRNSVFSYFLNDFIHTDNAVRVYLNKEKEFDFMPVSMKDKEFMRDEMSGDFYISELLRKIKKGKYVLNER